MKAIYSSKYMSYHLEIPPLTKDLQNVTRKRRVQKLKNP